MKKIFNYTKINKLNVKMVQICGKMNILKIRTFIDKNLKFILKPKYIIYF